MYKAFINFKTRSCPNCVVGTMEYTKYITRSDYAIDTYEITYKNKKFAVEILICNFCGFNIHDYEWKEILVKYEDDVFWKDGTHDEGRYSKPNELVERLYICERKKIS